MKDKIEYYIHKSINSTNALLLSEERNLLFALIFGLKPNKVLEIGTYKGGSAEIIFSAMETNKFGELTLIDKNPIISKKTWSKIKNRAKLFAGDSNVIIKDKLFNEKYDFIFIDGDHSYEGVLKDTYSSLNILNPGGYILYHDCHNKEIEKAIEEILKKSLNIIDCGILSTKTSIEHPGQIWGGFRLLKKHKSVNKFQNISQKAYNDQLNKNKIFHVLKQKIENKRNSKNVFWKLAVLTKDIGWKISDIIEIKPKIRKESDFDSEEKRLLISLKKISKKLKINNLNNIKNYTISLLFLTHNRLEKTKISLDSFIKALDREDVLEMIILDNASNKETIKYLKEIEKNKKIKIIYSNKNLGVAGGRDILFKKAQGDIIFSIDSDAILKNRRFIDMAKTIISDNEIGICGTTGTILKSWNLGDHLDLNDDSYYEGDVDFISGCCQIFRKSMLQYVSLDLNFSPFWYEDVDFCFQIKNLGKRIYRFNPKNTFSHKWGGSGSNYNELFKEKHQLILKKWRGKIKLLKTCLEIIKYY